MLGIRQSVSKRRGSSTRRSNRVSAARRSASGGERTGEELHRLSSAPNQRKLTEANYNETNHRFEELLLELAEVHDLDLEKQRLAHEEHLQMLLKDLGSQRGSLPTSCNIPHGFSLNISSDCASDSVKPPDPLEKVEPPVGPPGSLIDNDSCANRLCVTSNEQTLCSVVPVPSEKIIDTSAVSTVDIRWAYLVRRAIEVASREMHYSRDVWKDGLVKLTSQEQLAKQSLEHLSSTLSSVSSMRRASIKRANTVVPKILNPITPVAFLVSATKEQIPSEAFDPHSGPRFAWSVLAMALMLYDIVYIPMQAFNPPLELTFHVMDVLTQVYWTLDIPICFVTAVYVKSLLERRFSKIALMYIRTWFAFDLLVTVSQWFPLIAGDKNSASNLEIFRVARALRFLRLIRLVKFMHVLRDALEVVNSQYILLIIGIMKTMVLLLLFTHVVACIWFFIGTGNLGWVEQRGLQDASIAYQYLCSMHWTLTLFQGSTDILPGTIAERAYAVGLLSMALFILAWFVSSLTTYMGQMKDLHNGRHSQQRAVRNYMNENKISKHLSVAVNRYIEWNHMRHRNRQHDAEVLLVLPTKLLMDIYDEVRGPLLASHPFFLTFRENYLRLHRRLCYEALEQFSPSPSELVFAEGDECFHMFFVMCGQLRYEAHVTSIGRVKKGGCYHWEEDIGAEDVQVFNNVIEHPEQQPVRLNEKDWISEAVLWTDWEHCGQLIGLDDCALMLLSSNKFATIVKSFASARSVASLYARTFVAGLNRFGTAFTDVINHADLFNFTDSSSNKLARAFSLSVHN